MSPIIKYNLHLFIAFSVLTYFTIGSHFVLPEFLRPVLFILMIFSLIFSVMIGEKLKKGLSEYLVGLSKLVWTCSYMVILSLGSFVFNVLPSSTSEAILPIAAIYIIVIVYKINRKTYRTKA